MLRKSRNERGQGVGQIHHSSLIHSFNNFFLYILCARPCIRFLGLVNKTDISPCPCDTYILVWGTGGKISGKKNLTSDEEKNKAGRELGERVTIFKRMVGEDLTIYVTFEQRPEGTKTVN